MAFLFGCLCGYLFCLWLAKRRIAQRGAAADEIESIYPVTRTHQKDRR